MAIIVRATLPVEEFSLAETLREVPSAQFEIIRLIAGRGDGVVLVMRSTASEETDVESLPGALRRDPSTADVDVVDGIEDGYVVMSEVTDDVGVIRYALLEERATILDARGGAGGWRFRVLFPEHDSVSSTYDYCEERGIDLDVRAISQLSGAFQQGKYGLTAEQYEAIVEAYQEGYYSVPRTVKLAELADGFDVSHQALSERLRRGHGKLIGSVITPTTTEGVTNP